jgi:rare lipoprotein A
VGKASWYGKRFHGKPTASGERYDMYDLTAAHRRLPLGTLVRVTNLKNGDAVVVRINDRGPVYRSRIIDLSYEAAKILHLRADGVQWVRLDILRPETVAMAQQGYGLP